MNLRLGGMNGQSQGAAALQHTHLTSWSACVLLSLPGVEKKEVFVGVFL
jgi:hypothetical protein